METALTPKDLGELLRNTRKALGRTQAEVACALKTRRQTIADLEAGKNVGTHVMFNMLLYLGKGAGITDVRPTVDTIASFLEDDE